MADHLMLDLFAGTGSASMPFLDAGWEVIRVDLHPQHVSDVKADMRTWEWEGRTPTLIWASPPCTEFAREFMPWSRTGVPPSLDLIDACDRIIDHAKPTYWVIENVMGAVRYLKPRYGRPIKLGAICLWGHFPRFRVDVPAWKSRLSSRDEKERAAVPPMIGKELLKSIQADMARPRVQPVAWSTGG